MCDFEKECAQCDPVICSNVKTQGGASVCFEPKPQATKAAQGPPSNSSDLLVLRQLLSDIHSRATRKDRGVSLKEYLVRDLDHIAEKAHEAINEIGKLSTQHI